MLFHYCEHLNCLLFVIFSLELINMEAVWKLWYMQKAQFRTYYIPGFWVLLPLTTCVNVSLLLPTSVSHSVIWEEHRIWNRADIAFIMLRYVASIPAFGRVFYHKCMLNFVKGFFWIYWDNHMAFIFQFVNDLQILKNPCILGIKPTWSWCMIFLMSCWILIARILLTIFASMFISDIGL